MPDFRVVERRNVWAGDTDLQWTDDAQHEMRSRRAPFAWNSREDYAYCAPQQENQKVDIPVQPNYAMQGDPTKTILEGLERACTPHTHQNTMDVTLSSFLVATAVAVVLYKSFKN
ncbi:MAG TPA: hypothetical protein VJH88_00535 [Candidatus Nanoarchaeia archaeon]|nr:hypothetical protein [Candidatus Nanoarchaeia archaeon]